MCFGGHIECHENKPSKKKVKGGLTPQQLDHQVVHYTHLLSENYVLGLDGAVRMPTNPEIF